MTQENSETIYLDDGTVITIAVLPADSFSILRSSVSKSGTVSQGSEKSFSFDCDPTDGDSAELEVKNVSPSAKMYVSLAYKEGGRDKFTNNKQIGPDKVLYIHIDGGPNNKGLAGTFETTIEAYDDPVQYNYYCNQFWD